MYTAVRAFALVAGAQRYRMACRTVVIETASALAIPLAVLPILGFLAAETLFVIPAALLCPRELVLVRVAAFAALGPSTGRELSRCWTAIELSPIFAFLAVAPEARR
ncbi:hypothetical protein RRF57_011065 [Xylaria bambusicola]|uniref:Uncharacterized protein n=1 Tax=Xylaria bambusicola TaxID=326684 RepID=A0AAN7V290_9PEZI